MIINIKTILIAVLIIFVINNFNKKKEDFRINCNFEKFSDNATSSILDAILVKPTESIPESYNSESNNLENLKTIDQVNFESNYDISDDNENSNNK